MLQRFTARPPRGLGPAFLLAALVVSANAGCQHDGSPTPIHLVRATDWTVAPVADDLFADMRPANIECDDLRGHYLQENGGVTRFEINTGWCDYLTVTQPMLDAVEAGDAIDVRVFHFDLTGGPAEAYIGLGIGKEIVWDTTVPIPSSDALVQDTVEVTESVPSGTPLQLHIHNHGSNTWEIYDIDRLSSGP